MSEPDSFLDYLARRANMTPLERALDDLRAANGRLQRLQSEPPDAPLDQWLMYAAGRAPRPAGHPPKDLNLFTL